jgi:hypothetical protein
VKNPNTWLGLLALMMIPSYARNIPLLPLPPPREAAADASEPAPAKPAAPPKSKIYPSNVGAVNEGGGSTNTSGMSNGLSPNSSGSGTNASQAEENSGIPLGGGEPKGSVQQGDPTAKDKGDY